MNTSATRRPAASAESLTPAPGAAINDLSGSGAEARLAIPAAADRDEALVADLRAALSPAQMVERKLLTMLQGKALPVSHVRIAGLPQGRTRGPAPAGG